MNGIYLEWLRKITKHLSRNRRPLGPYISPESSGWRCNLLGWATSRSKAFLFCLFCLPPLPEWLWGPPSQLIRMYRVLFPWAIATGVLPSDTEVEMNRWGHTFTSHLVTQWLAQHSEKFAWTSENEPAPYINWLLEILKWVVVGGYSLRLNCVSYWDVECVEYYLHSLLLINGVVNSLLSYERIQITSLTN